jgi:PKD repeat protein
MKKIVHSILLLLVVHIVSAQSWVDVWQDDNASFSTKQGAFESYMFSKDPTQMKGWKAFKRWEYLYQRRMQTNETEAQVRQRALNYFIQQSSASTSHTTQTSSASGTWSFIGPSTTPSNGGGAGRVTSVTFNSAGVPFVGTPAGGVWKRTGTNWTTNTDNLTYLGISDILIDPSNNDLLYAATGDADAGDAVCIGVIKSVDGGLNWTSAGLTTVSRIYKIMAFGANYEELIACTNNGIYKTTNGGAAWTQVLSGVGTVHDMEFKPNSTSTLYAVTANGFYRSTNSGTSFVNVTGGLPTTGNNRRAIAVTPGNDNYVYLLASRSDNSGFHSFWRSTDGGTTFTKRVDGLLPGAQNLLGWSSAGTDASAGGQGWYDLSIAAHPINPEIVYTGGVNVWATFDGGSNWSLNGHWFGGGGVPYVHADIHNLDFTPTGVLHASCDGGLFENTNTQGAPNWTDISNGLQIAQMYRFGVSQTNDGVILTGWQDNGTNIRNSSVSNWRRVIGGDGFESAIDPTNANIMYGELYYGAISKSTNGGTNFTTIVSSGGTASTISEDGPWLTNFVLAPSNPNVMYVGKTNIYRNINGGSGGVASWTNATGIPTSGFIYSLAVAPTNENTVYASKGGNMYVATDGLSFGLRNTGLPGGTITYIAVTNNAAEAYCTVNSGTGNNVFKTTDAGLTWTNISGNLPNISPQCIAVDVSSPTKQLYVGHLNGIYTKNDTMAAWVPFDNALPNTEVTELEIVYSTSKIKAATYGRGAWESDLFTPAVTGPCLTAPTANFSANSSSVCPGQPVGFSNATSSCSVTNTYSWTFAGATPATSTAVNPIVTYSTPGTYSVTLVATNSNGSNTKVSTNLITVKPTTLQSASITADKTTICSYENVQFNYSGTNNGTNPTVRWFKNGLLLTTANNITINGLANGDVIHATVKAGANTTCISNDSIVTNSLTITVKPQPAQPVITQVVGDLLSNSATGNQWFNNAGSIAGATTNLIHPVKNGTFTVQTTINGCVSLMSQPFTIKIEDVNILFPVPNNGTMTFDFYAPAGVTSYAATVFNSIGEQVI